MTSRKPSSVALSLVILAAASAGAGLLIGTGGPWTQLSSAFSAAQVQPAVVALGVALVVALVFGVLARSSIAASLVILAVAIAGAGLFIGEGIRTSSAAQVQAQQQTTAAVNGAAAANARQAFQAAQDQALQAQTLQAQQAAQAAEARQQAWQAELNANQRALMSGR